MKPLELLNKGINILVNSRWVRKDNEYKPELGIYNGYTVMFVTNLNHTHERHPPQVVYQGDNGKMWSMSVRDWPSNLKPE